MTLTVILVALLIIVLIGWAIPRPDGPRGVLGVAAAVIVVLLILDLVDVI